MEAEWGRERIRWICRQWERGVSVWSPERAERRCLAALGGWSVGEGGRDRMVMETSATSALWSVVCVVVCVCAYSEDL